MAAAARQPRSLYLASPGSDYCVKVILLGDVGVGKTTILNTYTQGRPRVAHRASVSLSPSSRDRIVLYHDKKVKVSLWDTAGQERYRSLTASYYRGAQACIIVFDVHNQASFDNARKLWLESIREYSDPDSLVPVLVGTYRNGDRALRQVTKQRAQKMASEYQLPYFEVDCHQDPKELEFVMDNLVTLVMSKASQNEDFSRSIKPQRSRLAPQKKEYKCRGCCPF